jgi:Immunoglobulin domain
MNIIIIIITVPPDISDDDSSNDITVREGKNVTLYCNANGNPTPRITWRRDDGTSIIIQANETAMRKGRVKMQHIVLYCRPLYQLYRWTWTEVWGDGDGDKNAHFISRFQQFLKNQLNVIDVL